ncbi:MAG: tRNA (N(6)-L-threonylcarbamoyladenosine(37)-C(2))-methylthiotransferase [Desulfurococcales archaeon]|nr:tRNA (N(6)-L-threonylcarbamoyladenosine(37)-C(2))-methylthiotransferase [Desulfurococcales archaeon]
MPGGSYYIETYGCSLAEFDSGVMSSILESAGYSRVDAPEDADIVIVNTCSVRLETEQRIALRLQELSRRLDGKKMIVAGCLVKSRPGLVNRVAPRAHLLSPQNVDRVLDAVSSRSRLVLLRGSRNTTGIPRLPVVDAVATVMVAEGCLNDCSFCISKLARRELKSYPPRVIVETVEDLVRRGAREVRLTGLDVAAYGRDLPGKPSIADLVGMILDKVEGDYRIRIGMMTPELAMEILDDLLDVYRDGRVFKFFHLPVQSGDDEVLRLMNRKYTVGEYKALHSRIKSRFPDSMVATDIIVGHPGEDEEAFERTLRLVEELRFERVHVAQYSIRPHTLSASMEQIPDPVKKERSRRLMRLVESIGREIHEAYVGGTYKALVTERSFREDSMTARLQNYMPVVLGYDGSLLGSWVKVKVTGATFFDLRGVLAS